MQRLPGAAGVGSCSWSAGRQPLQLATRLRTARGDSTCKTWSVPARSRYSRRRIACSSSRSTGNATQLREIGVDLTVEEGDTIASLSQKYGFSVAKLRQANGGSDTISPGQKLEFVIKAPDNLMPVATSQGMKLVSAKAGYSDDEQEVGTSLEHAQIQELQRQHELRQSMAQLSEPHPIKHVVSTARFLGVGAAKVMLLYASLIFFVWAAISIFGRKPLKTRLEDPKVRADMERRHGRSFVEHLDQEHAHDEAEEEQQASATPPSRLQHQPHYSQEHPQRLQQGSRRTAHPHSNSTHGASQSTIADTGFSAAHATQPSASSDVLQSQQQQHKQPVEHLHTHQAQQAQQAQLAQQAQQAQQAVQSANASAASQPPQQQPHAPVASHQQAMPAMTSSQVAQADKPAPQQLSIADRWQPAGSPTPAEAASSQQQPVSSSAIEGDDSRVGTVRSSPISSGQGEAPTTARLDPALIIRNSMQYSSHAYDHGKYAAGVRHRQEDEQTAEASDSSHSSHSPETREPDLLSSNEGNAQNNGSGGSHAGHDDGSPSESRTNGGAIPSNGKAASSKQSGRSPASSSSVAEASQHTAADAAADSVGEPSWLNLDTVYLPCNLQKAPMNYLVGGGLSEGGEDREGEPCRLVFESESDLSLVLETLSEGLEEDLGLLHVPPLASLEDAVARGHPIAFFPAGIVLASAEHYGKIDDIMDWFEQLTTAADILTLEQAQQLLASKQDVLEKQQKQWGRRAEAQRAAAKAKARKQQEAVPDTSNVVSADRVVPPESMSPRQRHTSNGASEHSLESDDFFEQHASNGNGSSASGQSAFDKEPSHQADRDQGNAGASGRQDVQSRASAYAAMRRGEQVQLSKDALNQLDQSHLAQRAGCAEPVTQERPSSAKDADELKQASSSTGNRAKPAQLRKMAHKGEPGGWQKAKVVFVPVITYRDRSMSYLMVDMAPYVAANSQMHMLAFESRHDAEAARHLYQANVDATQAQVQVVPMPPDALKRIAAEEKYGISVYGPGQLNIKPGMTDHELAEAAASCSPAGDEIPADWITDF